MIRGLLLSLRPGQWIKNLFVFAAPFFGRALFRPTTALESVLAFVAFTLVASAVYLLNDVADRERDRLHPEKRKRPIAAGVVGTRVAIGAAVLLAAAGLATAARSSPAFGGLLAVYAAIQVGYSLKLRQVVILDVFCIASGFVIRVVGGAVATDVYLSSWLILTTIFVSLFLALCKRRAEVMLLTDEGGEHRNTLEEYDPEFLDQLIAVTTASVVLCYSLYTLDSRTVREFGTRNLLFTVPFVIYGIFRYLYLVHRRDGGGSPVSALIRDPWMALNALAWVGVSAVIIYGPAG